MNSPAPRPHRGRHGSWRAESRMSGGQRGRKTLNVESGGPDGLRGDPEVTDTGRLLLERCDSSMGYHTGDDNGSKDHRDGWIGPRTRPAVHGVCQSTNLPPIQPTFGVASHVIRYLCRERWGVQARLSGPARVWDEIPSMSIPGPPRGLCHLRWSGRRGWGLLGL